MAKQYLGNPNSVRWLPRPALVELLGDEDPRPYLMAFIEERQQNESAHEPRTPSRIGHSRALRVSNGEDPGGRRVDPG
jgi:hypothetical protein